MPKKRNPEPCPFCRFDGAPGTTEVEPHLGSGYQVTCPTCRAAGPVKSTPTLAVKAWDATVILALRVIANT